MIAGTIELLYVHDVGDITSRMIADASGTATNYISRYFGGRDGLLAAVADELGMKISALVRSDPSIMRFDQPGNHLSRITSIPEVALWFKLYRYLAGRNVPASTMRSGKPHDRPRRGGLDLAPSSGSRASTCPSAPTSS